MVGKELAAGLDSLAILCGSLCDRSNVESGQAAQATSQDISPADNNPDAKTFPGYLNVGSDS